MKVCNHPELFERADVVAPFAFSTFGRPGSPNREGDFVHIPYSTRNPIEYEIPTLLYTDGGLLDVPRENSPLTPDRGPMAHLLNIWSTDWIQRSLEEGMSINPTITFLFFFSFFFFLCVTDVPFLEQSEFAFLRFADVTPSEAHEIHFALFWQRRVLALAAEARVKEDLPYKSYVSFFCRSACEQSSELTLCQGSFIHCERDGYPLCYSATLPDGTGYSGRSSKSRFDISFCLVVDMSVPYHIPLVHTGCSCASHTNSVRRYELPRASREHHRLVI